jgi:hypothetical protein
MLKLKDLRNILTGILLVFLFATGAWAEQAKPLAGRELLRMIRELQGRSAKPAYETRVQEMKQKQEVVEEAAEPTEIIEEKEEPVITKEVEIEGEEAVPEEEPVTEAAIEPPITMEKTATIEPAATTAVDKVLSMIPAESFFVVRANSFESSLSQLDKFLAGALPMPFGPSMLIRNNLATILGSPDLKGVDMSGSFAVFALPTISDATGEPLSFVLVPVTDYALFVSGNANIGEADSEGISKITIADKPPLLVKQAGAFALIGPGQNGDKFIETAKAITDEGKTKIAGNLEAEQIKKATTEPLWMFVNAQAIPEGFDEKLSQQMAAAAMMSGGMAPAGEEMDIGRKLKELRFVSIAANPKPNVLNINLTVAAMEGSEAAGEFAADSPATLEFIALSGAKRPAEMGAGIASITALIPTAEQADFVGTYNLMKLLEAASAMKGTGEQATIPQAQSNLAFAITFDKDKLTVDIALPKAHLIELIKTAMTQFMPQMPQQGQQVPSF